MVSRVAHELNETTIALLAEALPGEQSVDARVRYLLEAELLRALGKHRRVNAAFVKKLRNTVWNSRSF